MQPKAPAAACHRRTHSLTADLDAPISLTRREVGPCGSRRKEILMDAALLVARLALAAVCALASVAKLLDLEGSRQAVIEFGLPAVLASPLAFLLPLRDGV